MREQIEVVYENGVLRPIAGLPSQLHEHQHLTITIEKPSVFSSWLADADASVSLESVRAVLAKIPGSLSQVIHAEREER